MGKGNPLALLRQVRPVLRRMLDDVLVASVGAELVIYFVAHDVLHGEACGAS